jgi:hypothetical protein
MKRLISYITALLMCHSSATASNIKEELITSPTEGIITHDFVPEAEMKDDLLQMLATFSLYMKDDFQPCVAPNSLGEACGCFRGENTMAND